MTYENFVYSLEKFWIVIWVRDLDFFIEIASESLVNSWVTYLVYIWRLLSNDEFCHSSVDLVACIKFQIITSQFTKDNNKCLERANLSKHLTVLIEGLNDCGGKLSL